MTSDITNAVLQSILDSVVEGILLVDFDNKIRLFNLRFAEMWKIPTNLLEQNNDDALIKYVLDQLTEPETFHKKVKFLYGSNLDDHDELKFKDGKVFERKSFPLNLESDKQARVWTFRDITEEVNRNREIEHYENYLEELVAKRTKDLEEANAKLEAFNYSTSHDLQAPLRSIDVYSAILLEEFRGGIDDHGKNCIDRIRDSTQQMEFLIEKLLKVSKTTHEE